MIDKTNENAKSCNYEIFFFILPGIFCHNPDKQKENWEMLKVEGCPPAGGFNF